IADNQTNRLSDWDHDRLVAELLERQKLDFDLDLTGFTTEDLSSFLSPANLEGLTDPDAIPNPPDAATTKRGDIWVLGPHRLLWGGAAMAENGIRLFDGAAIHLVNTDPPYNVKVEPRSNNAIAAGLTSFAVSHHQKLDVVRHPQKARPTDHKLRAKDRPLA